MIPGSKQIESHQIRLIGLHSVMKKKKTAFCWYREENIITYLKKSFTLHSTYHRRRSFHPWIRMRK